MKSDAARDVLRLGALNGGRTAPSGSGIDIDVARTMELHKVATMALRNDPSLPVKRPAPAASASLEVLDVVLASLRGRFLFEKGAACRWWYDDPASRDLSDVDIVTADESARRDVIDTLAMAGWCRSDSGPGLPTLSHPSYLPVDVRTSRTRWPEAAGDRTPPERLLQDLLTSVRRRGTILLKDVNDVAALATRDRETLDRVHREASPRTAQVLDCLIEIDALLSSPDTASAPVCARWSIPIVRQTSAQALGSSPLDRGRS